MGEDLCLPRELTVQSPSPRALPTPGPWGKSGSTSGFSPVSPLPGWGLMAEWGRYNMMCRQPSLSVD